MDNNKEKKTNPIIWIFVVAAVGCIISGAYYLMDGGLDTNPLGVGLVFGGVVLLLILARIQKLSSSVDSYLNDEPDEL